MREILFRGKTLTDKWVEGAYYKQDEFYGEKEDTHIIITSKETLDNDFALESHIVIPETVGQYTGLTDKNGNKIFEGDIVKGHWNTVFIVCFDECYLQFSAKTVDGCTRDIDYYGNSDSFEVIGNIHDNLELLKECESD